jgi:hypothetical protein
MSKISAILNIFAVLLVASSILFYWQGDFNGANYRLEGAIFVAVVASNMKDEK